MSTTCLAATCSWQLENWQRRSLSTSESAKLTPSPCRLLLLMLLITRAAAVMKTMRQLTDRPAVELYSVGCWCSTPDIATALSGCCASADPLPLHHCTNLYHNRKQTSRFGRIKGINIVQNLGTRLCHPCFLTLHSSPPLSHSLLFLPFPSLAFPSLLVTRSGSTKIHQEILQCCEVSQRSHGLQPKQTLNFIHFEHYQELMLYDIINNV